MKSEHTLLERQIAALMAMHDMNREEALMALVIIDDQRHAFATAAQADAPRLGEVYRAEIQHTLLDLEQAAKVIAVLSGSAPEVAMLDLESRLEEAELIYPTHH